MQTQMKIRWIRHEDVEECLAISDEVLDDLWTPSSFRKQLKRRRCFSKVASNDSGIIGFVICETTPDDISIIALAIRPDCWRTGIGSNLIDSIMLGHHATTRDDIYVAISEYDTRAHLFFKAMDFKCLLIADSEDHQYYVFERKLPT